VKFLEFFLQGITLNSVPNFIRKFLGAMSQPPSVSGEAIMGIVRPAWPCKMPLAAQLTGLVNEAPFSTHGKAKPPSKDVTHYKQFL